jgi:hypothetical protein
MASAVSYIVVSSIMNRRTRQNVRLYLTDAVNMNGIRRYGVERSSATVYPSYEAASADAEKVGGRVMSV